MELTFAAARFVWSRFLDSIRQQTLIDTGTHGVTGNRHTSRHTSRTAAKAALKAATLLLMLAMLSACATDHSSSPPPEETAVAPPPPPPPPPQPPPTDLAGRWKLTAGGACLMTLGASTGAADGSVAPAGGCPGNFFTTRKWTFEHDKLILRDYKGQALAELSFAGGRFEGQTTSGGAITLARP